MKKINFLLLFVFLSVFSFAQIDIYTPNLKLPENNAENQMPNAVLDWDAVAGSLLINYEAQIDTDSVFSNPVIFNTDLTSVENQHLLFNQKYFWRVRAKDGIETSYWSEVRFFTIFDNIALTIPSSGSTVKKSIVTINWNDKIDNLKVTGIKCFDYQLDTTQNFNSLIFINNTVDSTVFKDAIYDIQFGARYYWRVRARHDFDTSSWTTRLFYVVDSIPMIPKLISPPNNVINYFLNPNLSWSKIKGTEEYIIGLDISPNFNNPYFFETENTSLSLLNDTTILGDNINLLFGQDYYWRVKAVGKTDSSGWANTFKFTTAESTHLVNPINDTLVPYNNLELKWRNIGSEKYYYEIDTTLNFADTNYIHSDIITGDTIVLIETDTLFDFGTNYFWSILAYNDTIESEWSEIESFTTLDTILLQPQLISPENFSKRQFPALDLVWGEVYWDSLYQIGLDTSPDFNNPYLFETDNTSLSLLNDTTILGDSINLLFGQDYYWRVKALTDYDTSSWSEIYEFTVIDTLNTYTPHDDTAHQELNLRFDWEDILGITYYDIQIDTTPNFENLLVNDSTTNPTYNASLYYLQTDYFWRIRTRNEYDESVWSIHTFKTLDTIPSAPSLLYPLNMSINQMTTLTLEWNKLFGADSCEVQISESPDFANPLIFNTDNTYQYIENLLFGQDYYWRVRASNEQFLSDWSFIFEFNTLNKPTLSFPLNFSEFQMPDVVLKCDTIAGVVLYEFEIDTTEYFENSVLVESDSNLFRTDNLLFGQTYYWRVKAKNQDTTSDWSNIWSFSTFNIYEPQIFSPYEGETDINTDLGISWLDTISGITNYEIQLDISSNFNSSQIISQLVSFDNNSLVFYTQLSYNEIYYWRIRVINDYDSSLWSSTKSFKILNKVNLVYPEVNANNQYPKITLRWESLPGAKSYDYQIDTISTFNGALISGFLDNTSYFTNAIIDNLKFGQKYYWRIRAKNNSGISAWSEIRSFTITNTIRLISPEDNANNIDILPIFNWENVPGINDYILQYDSLENFGNNVSIILKDTLNGSYEIPSPLIYNTKYYWRIRGKNNLELTNWSNIWEFTTLISIPYGYDDLEINSNIIMNIYPNPCKDNVSIKLVSNKSSIITVKLINLLSVVLFDRKVNLISNISKDIRIDINNVPNGIYIVRINENNSFYSKRLVILK